MLRKKAKRAAKTKPAAAALEQPLTNPDPLRGQADAIAVARSSSCDPNRLPIQKPATLPTIAARIPTAISCEMSRLAGAGGEDRRRHQRRFGEKRKPTVSSAMNAATSQTP